MITVDPAVGVYFDDIYLGRANGQITELFDIDRVEVLKGPQGTLYGRNTTGGALRVITKKADPSVPAGGAVTMSYGNYRYMALDAAVNLPLVKDVLAVRLAGTLRRNDGWSKMVVTDGGNPVADPKPTGEIYDTNSKNWKSVRGSIVAKAADNITLTIAGDYTEDKGSGMAMINRVGDAMTGSLFGGTAVFSQSPENKVDFWTIRGSFRPFANFRQWGTSGTLDWAFGPAALKIIAAHRKVTVSQKGEVDGADAAVVDSTYDMHMKQDSVEAQLSGQAFNDRLKWLVGGFWFDERGAEKTGSDAFYGFDHRDFSSSAINRSKSLFTHMTLDVTDQLSLTGGFRYTWDQKTMTNDSRLNGLCPFLPGQAGFTPAPVCTLFRDVKQSFPSWTVGADYKINNDVMAYVKSSRATRSGGQQARGLGIYPNVSTFGGAPGPFDSSAPFRPETLTDVEIGLKSVLFNRMLKFNIDYYHSWVKDQQQTSIPVLTQTPPQLTTTFIFNVPGTSKVQGVELESTLRLGNFSIDLNGSYTDAKSADPSRFLPTLTPKWKASVGGTYEIPVDYGTWSLNATYAYTAKSYANPDVSKKAFLLLPGYSLVNARIGLNLKNGLKLSAWGQNLFNEQYFTFGTAFTVGPLIVPTGIGAPRMYGVSVGADF